MLRLIGEQWQGNNEVAEIQAIQYLAGLSIMEKFPKEIKAYVNNYFALNNRAVDLGIVRDLGYVPDHLKEDLRSFFLANECDLPEVYKEKLKSIYTKTETILGEQQFDRLASDFIKKFSPRNNNNIDNAADAIRYLASLAIKGQAVPEILQDKEMLGKFNKLANSIGLASEKGFVNKEVRLNLNRFLNNKKDIFQYPLLESGIDVVFAEAKEALSALEQKSPKR